jgi:hypothetical protein
MYQAIAIRWGKAFAYCPNVPLALQEKGPLNDCFLVEGRRGN